MESEGQLCPGRPPNLDGGTRGSKESRCGCGPCGLSCCSHAGSARPGAALLSLSVGGGGSWDPPGRGSSGPPESVGRTGAPAALTWDGLRPADHCGPHPARPHSDSTDLMALSASYEWNQTGFVLLNCQLACFIRQNVLKIRPAGMLLPSFFL